MTWQLVESVPRDATRILATDGESVAIVYFEGTRCWSTELPYGKVTHWMPLPDLPGKAQ